MSGARLARAGARHRQRGIAAIEFALIFTALFLGIYGVTSLGAVLYVKQVVSRAAEDGARAALLVNLDIAANDPRVLSAIYESLASSSITPPAAGSTTASKRVWLQTAMAASPPQVTISNAAVIAVRVTYPYGANAIVPILPFTAGLIPANMLGKATTAKPPL